ncbi:hypothetical protein ACJJIF_06835 [Microbulbifer sp. SSSA002]|uniref:hypothetical protein n=1 Tax=unclassified Microbulbifer TaxID=2619833 RepID=UPI004038FCE8
MPSHIWSLSDSFKVTFDNLPKEHQDKIINFIDVYEEKGLANFSNYEGKVSPSWREDQISKRDKDYAQAHNLWHYHVGIPKYVQVHDKYKTSDWLLHFQWTYGRKKICLVDIYSHWNLEGNFHLPPKKYLDWVCRDYRENA